jgi:hypothetical protein
LLAATAVHAASVPGPTEQPVHRPQQMAFAFGRGLVVPPRELPVAAETKHDVVPADAAPEQDTTPRPHPYRSACNFTTGCH